MLSSIMVEALNMFILFLKIPMVEFIMIFKLGLIDI